jgi:hypothetical protein
MSECPVKHDAADSWYWRAMLADDCEQALSMVENRWRIAPQLICRSGKPKRVADARHVCQSFGEDDASLASLAA